MNADWLASPPVALVLFLGLTGSIYWLSGRWSARSPESTGKHLPYACGEDIIQGEVKLSYRSFFRLALMFVIVHMGILLLAMLPYTLEMRYLATAYLVGIAICVDVLVRGER